MRSFRLYRAVAGLILATASCAVSAQTVGYNSSYYHPVAPQPRTGPPCGHYLTPACPPDPNAPRTTADAPSNMTGDALIVYSNNQIARGDKVGGLKTLERAAAEGNVVGMRGAGIAYIFGATGVTDVPKGMAYLEQAAATGDGTANFHLGHLYQDGTHVQADQAKAIRYLYAAAQKRSWYAEFFLGMDYAVGNGVAANRATAIAYMERAAQDTNQDTPRNYLIFLRKAGNRHWNTISELSSDYLSDYVQTHTPPPVVRGPITPGSAEWFNRITGNSPVCRGPAAGGAAFCPR